MLAVIVAARPHADWIIWGVEGSVRSPSSTSEKLTRRNATRLREHEASGRKARDRIEHFPLWAWAGGTEGERWISAWKMVQRRASAAGITTEVCNHTFRSTGITAYLENGGTLEKARARWRRMPQPAPPNSTISARTDLRTTRW